MNINKEEKLSISAIPSLDCVDRLVERNFFSTHERVEMIFHGRNNNARTDSMPLKFKLNSTLSGPQAGYVSSLSSLSRSSKACLQSDKNPPTKRDHTELSDYLSSLRNDIIKHVKEGKMSAGELPARSAGSRRITIAPKIGDENAGL
uniref:Uncharacterized protein n=1 Tax=Trieres chinensis TaxID=1514140 RepID=A0A7S2A2Y7_TRICV